MKKQNDVDNDVEDIIDEGWEWTAHLIVKYKPEFYNEKGHYIKDEWISISDVGRIYDGKEFTIEEYLDVEQRYVDAVLRIMELANCHYLTVSYLSDTVLSTKWNIERMLKKENPYTKYDDSLLESYLKFAKGSRISKKEIGNIVRLNLRELTDAALTNKKRGLQFHFGYDYYMLCNCNIPESILKEEVEKIGLHFNPRRQVQIS